MLKAISGKGHVVYYTVIHNARLLQLVPLKDHKRKQNNLSLKILLFTGFTGQTEIRQGNAQSFYNKKK